MPLLPSALPPKGEARRYVANDFLNLIAFPIGEGGPRQRWIGCSYIAYLRRSPSLSFIPPVPYPPFRDTFPTRGRLCVGIAASFQFAAFPIGVMPLS